MFETCRVLINQVKQAASRWLFTYTVLKSNFMKIRPMGAELFHEDMKKLIVTFRNFAKASKNADYFEDRKNIS